MIEFLKGMGSILKKDNNQTPPSGSQKISELADEEVYIDGETDFNEPNHVETTPIETTPNEITYNSPKLWDSQKLSSNPVYDSKVESPLAELSNSDLEKTVINNIISEILINKELLGNLSKRIAAILVEKASKYEVSNIETVVLDESLKTRGTKFIDSFNTIINLELESFCKDYFMGQAK